MTDTEPRGSDAEIVALLRACGMDEANLDDGVRNVRKIVRAKMAAVRNAEPVDLDAVYDRWIDWYNGAPNPDRWRHRDADESMSHCLAREDVPALIAEVRRLREEAIVEADIHAWFTSHSSTAVARVVADGQSIIDERMADGVFE